MRPATTQTLSRHMSVRQAQDQMQRSTEDFFVVGLGGDRWSGVRRATLLALSSSPEMQLGRALSGGLPYVYPDHRLDTVLRLMGEWPLLPVVHRANLQQLLGVISLDDVMRAYRGAGMARNQEGVEMEAAD